METAVSFSCHLRFSTSVSLCLPGFPERQRVVAGRMGDDDEHAMQSWVEAARATRTCPPHGISFCAGIAVPLTRGLTGSSE